MLLQTQVDNLKNQLDSFRGIFFKRGVSSIIKRYAI